MTIVLLKARNPKDKMSYFTPVDVYSTERAARVAAERIENAGGKTYLSFTTSKDSDTDVRKLVGVRRFIESLA
ncbi:MAG: hypothetical protein HUK20_00270 [Fibrobacter sp.]|nr:hypothetical protein [Fibrobacter sp.]